MDILPAINATLNAISAIALTTGYMFIKQRNFSAHRSCMLIAFSVSIVFLICYLVYHAFHGSTRFGDHGWVTNLYFFILISHIVLAIAIVPLALITLSRALRNQFDRHRRIARWTLPLWLYVSVTGVMIYIMLYHLYPST